MDTCGAVSGIGKVCTREPNHGADTHVSQYNKAAQTHIAREQGVIVQIWSDHAET